MDLIEHLLMKLVSFGGIGFLIYICSRNKYIFKYSSEKRKIEIYPDVNGKIKCRKMAKKNVVFPTFFVSPNS